MDAKYLLGWLREHSCEINFEGSQEKILRGIKIQKNPHKVSDTVVLFLNGRSDNIFQYAELYHDLYNKGYDLFTFDHRGQGYSCRLTQDRYKSHVETYDYFVEDLDTFYRLFVKPHGYKRLVVLGHSMGGAVSILWSYLNQKIVDKIILTAPMVEVLNPFMGFLSQVALMFLCFFGFAKTTLVGSSKKPSIGPFITNKLTRDSRRYERMCALNRMSDGKNILGKPTNGWGLETLKASAKVKKVLPALESVPGIIFQAGAEQYIRNSAHNKFKPKNWKIHKFEAQHHHLLHAGDAVRERIMSEIEKDA